MRGVAGLVDVSAGRIVKPVCPSLLLWSGHQTSIAILYFFAALVTNGDCWGVQLEQITPAPHARFFQLALPDATASQESGYVLPGLI